MSNNFPLRFTQPVSQKFAQHDAKFVNPRYSKLTYLKIRYSQFR